MKNIIFKALMMDNTMLDFKTGFDPLPRIGEQVVLKIKEANCYLNVTRIIHYPSPETTPILLRKTDKIEIYAVQVL